MRMFNAIDITQPWPVPTGFKVIKLKLLKADPAFGQPEQATALVIPTAPDHSETLYFTQTAIPQPGQPGSLVVGLPSMDLGVLIAAEYLTPNVFTTCERVMTRFC